MSEINIADSMKSQNLQKSSRIAGKKEAESYIWAVLILFVLVGLLCMNSFKLLNTNKELSMKLDEAHIRLKSTGTAKLDLQTEKDLLSKVNKEMTEEIKYLKEEYEKLLLKNKEDIKIVESYKTQNKTLLNKNKELTDDNIALQNSLKLAASVGIKPQKYSLFDELEPRNMLVKGSYAGKFLGTAYTPSKEECGNNKGITNSGHPIIPGVSLAVDKKYWPFGTVFYIKGLGYAIAMDTGSAIKGKYRFDFSVLDKDFAMKLGSRKWDVYVVKMGNGSVENIEL